MKMRDRRRAWEWNSISPWWREWSKELKVVVRLPRRWRNVRKGGQ